MALVKSCSIPGVIEPTIEGERVLVDGGIIAPIPVSILKNKCNFIIAVNISQNRYSLLSNKSKMYDLKGRADLIISNQLKFIETKGADFVFSPDTMGTHWSSFQKFEDLVKSGKNEAIGKIEQLENKFLIYKNNKNKE
jgi:NTE family protein